MTTQTVLSKVLQINWTATKATHYFTGGETAAVDREGKLNVSMGGLFQRRVQEATW